MTSINLSGVQRLTDAGVAALAFCPNLSSLFLSACLSLTPACVATLSKDCTSLTKLGLSGCSIEIGRAIVREVQNMSQLTSLDLRGCPLETSDTAIVDSCPRVMAFRHGTTPFTDITPEGTEADLKLPFHTYYRSLRSQFLYMASDISKAQLDGAFVISGIQLKVKQPPGLPLENFRIDYALTRKTELNSWIPTTTTCFGPVKLDLSAVESAGGWTTFVLSKPIIYCDQRNLVLQWSFYGLPRYVNAGSSCAVELENSTRARWYMTDEEYVWPFTDDSGNETRKVPCARLQMR